MTAVQKALRPVALRMRWQRALRFGCFALAGGSFAALLFCGASFLWPIASPWRYGLGMVGASGSLGLLVGWLWPVFAMEAAKQADKCGLKARIQTALELAQKPETPMITLQKSDALLALQGMRIKESMPLRGHRPALLAAMACICLGTVLTFVPNPQNRVLEARASFRQEMAKQAERIDKGAEAMAENHDRTAPETRKLLGELAERLRSAAEPRQALEAIDQTARRMEQLRQNETNTIQQALSQGGMEALAEALKREDEQAVQEEIARQGTEALSKALSEIAQASAGSANALQSAASALSAGNAPQAAQALMQAMAASSQSISQGNALLQMAQLAAAQAGQPLGVGSPAMAAQAMAALGAQGQGGTGQGVSSAQIGMAGGGAGLGSTNQDMGYQSSAGAATGGGGRAPQEKIGEYEAIYDPTRLGGTGEVKQERGLMGEGDISEVTVGGTGSGLEEAVPYAQVALEYREAAVQSVENANLPSYVQKWVENYFQSLLE